MTVVMVSLYRTTNYKVKLKKHCPLPQVRLSSSLIVLIYVTLPTTLYNLLMLCQAQLLQVHCVGSSLFYTPDHLTDHKLNLQSTT